MVSLSFNDIFEGTELQLANFDGFVSNPVV